MFHFHERRHDPQYDNIQSNALPLRLVLSVFIIMLIVITLSAFMPSIVAPLKKLPSIMKSGEETEPKLHA